MHIYYWIPSVTTTTIVALVLWLFRSLVTARLKASVQHEFDRKIEVVRTDLRNSEEQFKADLQSKASEMQVLRASVISGLVNRQAELDKRRIVAVERVWSAITSLAQAKSVSGIMAHINLNVAGQGVTHQQKLRALFGDIGQLCDINSFKAIDATHERPFISPTAWAFFAAYKAACVAPVILVQGFKNGLDATTLIDTKQINKLIEAALPHQAEYLAQYGLSGYHHLLDELESHLLSELQGALHGAKVDHETLQRAAQILKASNEVMVAASAVDLDASKQ